MSIESLLALAIILLFMMFLYFFAKKLEKNRIKKIGLDNYLQQKEDNIIYERGRKIPPINKTINFLLEGSYRPKIDYFEIGIFFVFIISGLFFAYLNQHEKNLLYRYIPLIFTIFGAILLYRFFSTAYLVKEKELVIKHGGTTIINYQNITKIEKHIINMLFKHGRFGRKRAETHKDTVWVFYNDDKNIPRVIMVSPLEKDMFIEHVILKIVNQS